MTIKEAFQKLTSTCSAGMKNPFFIMRNLHDAFADISDKIVDGGGGSTVEVTQVVSSGTKIATITVDDTPTDLYAPNSVNYSTTARKIGTWIDGSDVYEQTTEFNSEINVSYNSWESSGIMTADIDKIIDCIGIASGGWSYGSIMAWNDNGDIKLQTTINGAVASVKYLIMRYTIVSE